jgi:hypothetical protein
MTRPKVYSVREYLNGLLQLQKYVLEQFCQMSLTRNPTGEGEARRQLLLRNC